MEAILKAIANIVVAAAIWKVENELPEKDPRRLILQAIQIAAEAIIDAS